MSSRFSAPTVEAALPWYTHWAARGPERMALVTSSGTTTFAELAARIAHERDRLARTGLEAGAALVHARHADTAAWLATLVAGLDLGLQLILPDEDWPVPQIGPRTQPLLSSAERSRRSSFAPDASPPPGVWLFTSGTTQHPKPRLRTLALLKSDVARVAARLPPELRARGPRGLCGLPLSHGFGLVNGVLLIHALGGTVLLENLGNRHATAALIGQYDVDVLYAWPAQLDALADSALWQRSPSPLVWCVSSSMRLTKEVAARFERASGCPVRQQYGATETGPLCLDADSPPSRETHCVGRPLDGVEVRVLSAARQDLTLAEQEGEIAVKVTGMSLPPEELRSDGYWPTGDRGYCDEHGRVHVSGRFQPFTDERNEAAGEAVRRDLAEEQAS